MAHLSPADQWPRHSRSEAQAALKDAKNAGWFFRPAKGHAFGVLRCSDPSTETAGCRLLVYSTAKGPADGSDTAKVIRQAMRKCPHQVEEPSEPARSAAQLLRRVDSLLDACGRLRRREEAEASREVAAERGDESGFDSADAEFQLADNDAAIALEMLGYPTEPWSPEKAIGELIADAQRQLDEVLDEADEAQLRHDRITRLRHSS